MPPWCLEWGSCVPLSLFPPALFSFSSFLFAFLAFLCPFHCRLSSACLLFLSPLFAAWTLLNFTKCRRCHYQQQRARLTAGAARTSHSGHSLSLQRCHLPHGQKEVGTSWHLVNPEGKLPPKIDVPAISQKAQCLRE